MATGWLWLKQGFALFRLQPGFLTMIAFCNFLFSIVLSAVPLLGGILLATFIPAFTMAVMQTCRVLDEGERITPALVLTGFRQPAFKALCKLGLVYFALFVVAMLVVSPWVDLEALRQMGKMTDARALSVAQGSTSLAIVLCLLLIMLSLLMLSMAPGLTYWKQMPTFKAVFYSVFAVLGSLRAFLGMVIAWVGINWILFMVLFMIFGRSQFVVVVLLWLNLVSTLILQCALYAAYKQIMGAPEAPLKPD